VARGQAPDPAQTREAVAAVADRLRGGTVPASADRPTAL